MALTSLARESVRCRSLARPVVTVAAGLFGLSFATVLFTLTIFKLLSFFIMPSLFFDLLFIGFPLGAFIAAHRQIAGRRSFLASLWGLQLIMLASIGCCLLGGSQARSEVIDFSKMTCKQFFDTHKGEVSLILAWLDGYSREDSDPPVLDTSESAAGAKKITEYRAAHPAASLMTAVDEIFAH